MLSPSSFSWRKRAKSYKRKSCVLSFIIVFIHTVKFRLYILLNMTTSLFVSSGYRATLRKLCAGFLMLSLNLTGGVGAIFLTTEVAYAAPVSIFSDGLEATTFGNWTSNTGNWHNDATDDNTLVAGGTKSARVTDDTGATNDYLTKAIPTSGYTNIQIEYYAKVSTAIEAGDFVRAEWRSTSSGVWEPLASSTALIGPMPAGVWFKVTGTFPSTADNKAGFEFRLSANLQDVGRDADKIQIDDVSLMGTQIMHTLTVASAGNGSGAISSVTQSYAQGTTVTLTATPSTGSTFTGWSGDCSGVTCSVTMDAAKSATATFTLNTYALSLSKAGTGSGAVSSSPAGITCGATCSASFNHNQVVVLTAAPSVGSTFTGWSGSGCSGTGTCSVTIDAAKSVTAAFALNQHVLTVNTTGGGSVSSTPAGISCGMGGSDCDETYNHTTTITLTALPDTASSFAGWGGACAGTGACVVTMDSARSVSASFVALPPTPCPVGTVGIFPNCITIIIPTPCPVGTVGAFMPDCAPIVVPPLSCEETVSTMTRVSNTTDVNVGTATGSDAVLVDFDADTAGQQVHTGWTASIPGAQWIWNENPVSSPTIDQYASFFDVFTVVGTPTGGTLTIAADNTYEVYLNGTQIGGSAGGLLGTDENNFQLGTQDIVMPITNLVSGQNTLEVRVKNKGISVQDWKSNPAGLLYKLTVNKNACVPDVCPNIPEVQSTLPSGYEMVAGQCVLIPVCEPQVNLVANGGFETPVLTTTWDMVPFTNSALKWLGQFVTPGGAGRLGLEIQASAAGAPFAGVQHAELDGDHPTRIYQDVVTIPGHDYSLKYFFSPRPDTAASENILEVAVGGSVVDTHTGAGTGSTVWTPYTKTFVATATVTRIAFADIGNDDNGSTGGVGSYLDDVSFSCVGVHVVHNCPDGQHWDGESCVPNEEVPATTTLTVIKHVINDNGGTKTAEQFTLHINQPAVDMCNNIDGMQATVPEGMSLDGNYCYSNEGQFGDSALNTILDFFSVKTAYATVVQLFSPQTFSGNEAGTVIIVAYETDYVVTEDADAGYTTTYSADCTGHIALGEHKTCTVTNDDIQQGGGGGGSTTSPYPGCTNPLAVGYNPLANVDDGSCVTGGGGNGGGSGTTTTQGEVLGAATAEPELALPAACAANPYLRDFMKMGKKNDPEQVKLLQTFLNEFSGSNLPVSGIFGSMTKKAVKKLQKANHTDIIQPWIDAGYNTASLKEGTGIVYKTTKYFINKKKCGELMDAMPELKGDQGMTD